jgi:hypothetical protein
MATARLPDDAVLRTFVEGHCPALVREFSPDHIIIFGSRVNGQPHEWSDLDVVLVARAFEGLPFRERGPLVRRSLGSPGGLEILCYTPEQFEELRGRGVGVVATACKEGIWLEEALK